MTDRKLIEADVEPLVMSYDGMCSAIMLLIEWLMSHKGKKIIEFEFWGINQSFITNM